MLSSMSLCLTFDDGFRVHHDIAAPVLEQYGWRGAFNVPTEFMNPRHEPLTPEQLWDCRLEGNEDNLMTWDDVRDLLSRGHEVYPHTLGHVDLLQLEKIGDLKELSRQVCEARRQFEAQTGIAPRFFCSPHNSMSPTIAETIAAEGMIPFNCSRRNFPTHPTSVTPSLSIGEYLELEYRRGMDHVDVMIHGIGKHRGGWEPFDTVESFESFCNELSQVERSGLVRVVRYSQSHPRVSLVRRIRRRIRRTLFVCCYGE